MINKMVENYGKRRGVAEQVRSDNLFNVSEMRDETSGIMKRLKQLPEGVRRALRGTHWKHRAHLASVLESQTGQACGILEEFKKKWRGTNYLVVNCSRLSRTKK